MSVGVFQMGNVSEQSNCWVHQYEARLEMVRKESDYRLIREVELNNVYDEREKRNACNL